MSDVRYRVITRPLDGAAGVRVRDVEIPVPRSTGWLVLDVPAEAAATLRLGSVTADPIPLRSGRNESACEPFDRAYLDYTPAAGEVLRLWVGEGRVLADSGAEAVGPSSEGEPVAGRPVQIAGVHRAVAPTYPDGAIVRPLMDAAGRFFVRLADRLNFNTDSVTAHLSGPVELAPPAAAVTQFSEGSITVEATATIDTGARFHLTAIGSASVARDFYLEVSKDGVTWRVLDSALAATAYAWTGTIGYRHARVRIAAGSAADILIELSSK
jgi:hypothetical protein